MWAFKPAFCEALNSLSCEISKSRAESKQAQSIFEELDGQKPESVSVNASSSSTYALFVYLLGGSWVAISRVIINTVTILTNLA